MAKAKKLPSGSWRVNQYIGKDENGKRIYKSFTAETKKAAEYAAAEYVAKNKQSIKHITVGECIDRYIAAKEGVLSPTTIRGYKSKRDHHLQGIMDIPIDRLTREQVQAEISRESAKFSAKTVIDAHGLLSASLAMQNPDFVLHTTLPRKVKKLRRELPPSDVVMDVVAGTEIELPVLLAMCLCLRMSEVRGIRKEALHGDILLIERVIVTVDGKHIEKELAKTDDTRRAVDVPPFLAEMLANAPTERATELSGQAIYKRFTRMMNAAGYPGSRFHDLRHISASDMHRCGISDRVAAERGGWSGTQTMKQVYQHSFSADRVAANKIMSDYYATQYATRKIKNIEDA